MTCVPAVVEYSTDGAAGSADVSSTCPRRLLDGLGIRAGQSSAQNSATRNQEIHMATITKKELIDRLAEVHGCKRVHVKRLIQSFLDTIVDELSKGNRLEFRDFGVFESRLRAPRQAQNPKTMAKVTVPSRRTVKFKVGRVMKRCMDAAPIVVDEATGLLASTSAGRGAKRPTGAESTSSRA